MELVYMSLDGNYRRFDTDDATYLGGTEERRARRFDLYRSPKGRLIRVSYSRWVGEKPVDAEELEEQEVLALLVDECSYITEEGYEFIDQHTELD